MISTVIISMHDVRDIDWQFIDFVSFVDSSRKCESGQCFYWFQNQIRVLSISLVHIDHLKNSAYISNEIYLCFSVYSGGEDPAVSAIGRGNDVWSCQAEK